MSENLDNLLVEAFSKNLFKDTSNEDKEDGEIDKEEGEIDSGDDNKHKHKDKHKKTKIKVKSLKSSKHKSKIKPKINSKLAKDKYYALKKLSKAKTRLKSTKTGSKTKLEKSSKCDPKSDSKSKSKIKKSKSSDKTPKSVKKTDKNGYETDSEVMKLLLSKQLRSYADIQFKDEELSPEEEIPKKSSKHKSSKSKDGKHSVKSKRHKKSKHSDDYEFQKDSYYPSHSSTSHEDYFYGSYYEGMEEDSLRGSRSRGYSRPLSPLHESEWRYRSRSPLDYSRESDHNSSHRRRSMSPEERSYRDRQRSVTPFYKDGYSKPYRHSRRSVSPGNRSYRSGSVSSVGSSSSCRSVNRVDKQKLLEIARINLIKMIEKGDLPKGTDINKLKLKHLRELTTQKSVQQWTEFCRAISTLDSGIYDSDLDSDSDNDDIKSVASDQPFSIRHPFKLTERKDIQIRVRGFQQLASRTAKEMAIELREQFPVSSGNIHRRKELEWHEVDQIPAPLAICAAPKKAKKIETKLTEILNTPKTIPDEQLAYKMKAPTPPTIPQTPPTISTTSTDSASITSSDQLSEASPSTEVTTPTSEAVAASDAILMPPPPPPPPLSKSSSATSSTSDIVGAPLITPASELPPNSESTESPSNVSETTDSVFPQSSMTIDIGSVMAQRLSAMRKLQEDPHNVVALKQMYQANQMMTEWAESKIVPGQYTGSTGANILSPEQLTGSYNAWTRKDQLKNAAPITGGIGMLLLLKMGWSPGQGLGKNNEGSVNPIMLDIKTDKKGLVAEEEQVRNLPLQLVTSGPPNANSKFLSKPGKNPVSILHELCAKKRWNQPEYEIVNEMGPDHRKNFTFKVLLNGVEYQPSVSSGNKKQAKALAAGVCLQAFGLLPKDNV